MHAQTKYLIQMETGRIYHWSPFLAARADMAPYDEKLFGEPNAEGKSPVLQEKAEGDKEEAKGEDDDKDEGKKNSKASAKK